MYRGIRFKLVSTVITLLVILISINSIISYNLEKKALLYNMEENSIILSRILSGSISTVEQIKQRVKAQDLIKMLSLTEGIFEIDIYDEQGKIIFATFERRLGMSAKSPQVYGVLKQGYFLSGFRAYKEEIGLEFEEAVFKGFYPLIFHGKTIGVVGIAFEIYDYLLADAETKRVLLKEMKKNARLLGETVAYGIKDIMEIEILVQVENLIDTIVKDALVIYEINIISDKGDIVISNQKQNIGTIVKEKKFSKLLPIRKDGKTFYEIFLPIKISETEKTVNILYDPQDLYVNLRRILNSNILIAILSLTVSIPIYLYLSTQVTRPISRLAKATELISAGNLNQRIAWNSKDELGKLANSFNVMIKMLRETQERMVRSAKLAAIGQLAAGIAHELRNPLSVIKNSIYFLNSRIKNADEKIAKHISMMNKEVDISEKIIADLLNFSRSSTAGLSMPVQINELLESIFSFLVLQPKVVLKKELQENLPKINGDPDQLRQVFLNIILNAVDAMPSGGELKITTKKEDGVLKVVFQDNGQGIPKENIVKLFDPFFTTKTKGTGLGLAITHEIVEGHKGYIEVESEINKGSTFSINFPYKEERWIKS